MILSPKCWCVVLIVEALSRDRLSSGVFSSFQSKSLKLCKTLTPTAEFYTGWSKASPEGWHMPRLLTFLMRAKDGQPILREPFHPRILFICPVAHATLDHNGQDAPPTDITSRLFQPLLCHDTTWEGTQSKSSAKYQLNDAVHTFTSLYQCLSAVLKLTETKRSEETLRFAKGPY